MMRKIVFTLSLGLSAVSSWSQVKYSNEFLSIGVGARALGMSNSVVATADDATSGYWNPAGLVNLGTDMQVGVMHSEYFAGIAKFDYASMAKTIDSSSAFAVSIIRFGVDDIPNTIELIDPEGNVDYDRIKKFSAADYAFIASYARKLKVPGLTFGANFKVIHRKVGDFGRSWGFGLDASLQYKYKNWQFGAMARDITTTFNAWSYTITDEMQTVFTATGNEIPSNSLEITMPRLLLGTGRKFMIKEKFSLLTEIDFDLTFDGKRNVPIKSDFVSIDPHLGFELGYRNIVFVRGGFGNIQQSTDVENNKITTFQPNLGIGLKIKRISLDYALTDIGDQSVALYSNVFSLKFDINKLGGS